MKPFPPTWAFRLLLPLMEEIFWAFIISFCIIHVVRDGKNISLWEKDAYILDTFSYNTNNYLIY